MRGMDSRTLPGGLLVAIDGIDGAGKTTLAHHLAEMLRGFGNTVTCTKEPTAGPWGQRLRDSAHAGRLSVAEEVELFRRDRAEHVEQVIAPALARGEVVVLDRYYYSTAAYQGAAGADYAAILADSEAFPRPHVALLLDVPVETGLARIRARGDTPNRFEDAAALEAARAHFLAMESRPELVRIDASLPADEVLRKAWAHVLAAVAERARAAHGFTPAAAEAVTAFAGTRASAS